MSPPSSVPPSDPPSDPPSERSSSRPPLAPRDGAATGHTVAREGAETARARPDTAARASGDAVAGAAASHGPTPGVAARGQTSLDAKTAADLEWNALLGVLARRCVGPLGADALRSILPETDRQRANERVARLAEAIEVAARGEPLPRDETPELDATIGRLRRGATATGVELRALGTLLAAARRLRAFLSARRELAPKLWALLGTSGALDGVETEIGACIEPDGRVADGARAELRDARRRVTDLRIELHNRLGQLVRRYGDLLSDDYWTEREGRHVLPVRSDAHERIEGIVHGTSASGATHFVEPLEVMRLGNGIRVAEAEVERVEELVRAELSDRARERLEEIVHAAEACIGADVLGALAAWAIEAHCLALPTRPDAVLDLRDVRHPLLVARGSSVVGNDIAVRAGEALVISGPNAGGKTVALKCLGLIAWMARAGLPLPLDPRSEVGWMDPVLTDVGDEQSLLTSLSTFSAHVAKLSVVLRLAKAHALVLLDELAAGTDPEEGAALAIAVLEALVARGAAAVVTTHYERLKEVAAEGSALRNASFGFDAVSMSPTFRLSDGVPGSSSALAVAARYGIEPVIIERARALVPEAARARALLTERLEQERAELERARRQAGEEVDRQRQLREAMDAERKRVREKERARLAAEGREITEAVRQARADLRRLRLELRDGAGQGRAELRDAERAIDTAASHVALGSPLARALADRSDEASMAAPGDRGSLPTGGARSDPTPPPKSAFAVGVRVWIPRLGALAEVVEPARRGKLQVMIGGMRTSVRLDEVHPASEAGGRRKAPRSESRRRAPVRTAALGAVSSGGDRAAGFVPVRTASNTADLRGMRVDEALDRVDQFIDEMLQAGEPAAYVLHGHGTGALKSAVREHLALSSWVAQSAAADQDDGGDALTVFWLKA